MKKWISIDSAQMPDGKTISLHQHDESYAIRVNGAPLMSTRQHASETRIAELACAHVARIPRARVLIGGLGFGFTLRATLAALGSDATVVVVEINGAVIRWNRNAAFSLAADVLGDKRVALVEDDVANVIRDSRRSFDAIILDVDNGPAALSNSSNQWLYDSRGLEIARVALRWNGCLAFWSAASDPAFERLLAGAGFEVEAHRCRPHTLFLARLLTRR